MAVGDTVNVKNFSYGPKWCQVLWSKFLVQCPVKYFCLMNVWSDAVLTTFSDVTPIDPKKRWDNFHLQCRRRPTYPMIHREPLSALRMTKSSHAGTHPRDNLRQDAVVLTNSQPQFPPSPTESPQPPVRRLSLRDRRPPEYLKEYDTEIRFSVWLVFSVAVLWSCLVILNAQKCFWNKDFCLIDKFFYFILYFRYKCFSSLYICFYIDFRYK